MEREEHISFIAQEKTLPGWLRGRGLKAAVNMWVPGWTGPEPKELTLWHTVTHHDGPTLDSPGFTVFFFLPGEPPLPPADWLRLEAAASYIIERMMGRKKHNPLESWTSYRFPAAPPGVN
jgi:hypothetical protein